MASHPPGTEFSLRAVQERAEEPIPPYAGAGVPLAVVAALNHARVPVRFMEFAAASGWAFSFGYTYYDASAAYMAVRGNPERDGPLEMFAFLPHQYGMAYEMALTADPAQLWSFATRHVDSGTPIMSEHMDGGLIASYRTTRGHRQLFFDGTVTPGWIDVEAFNPYAVYSFVKAGDSRPRPGIICAALERAVAKGTEHEWEGVPQGLAALRQYHADVSDAAKDFSKCPEWFCWAAFERLMARRCAEVWLRSVASTLTGDAKRLIATAADRYGEAFRCYDRYLGETQGCNPPGRTLTERARTPARIGVIAPLLERGIAEEAAGLEGLMEALSLLQ
ncbi:MAG: BtrH N-terminal domain-containing protein [Gemmatimonadota bacterium]|nr:BtrH N-terminal domain-containing protein [Gemmatimonadota bacterium]